MNDPLLTATNHPIEGWLRTDTAVRVAQKLFDDTLLDQTQAAGIGTHLVREVWPWLEACLRADLVEAPPQRPGPARRLLLLSSRAPSQPAGNCPIPTVWRTQNLRVVMGSPSDSGPGVVTAVEPYRDQSSRVVHLREMASRTSPAGGRCYPP